MNARTGSHPLKRAMLVLLALAMALYFAPGALLAPQRAWAADGGAVAGSSGTTTASSLEELQSAINDTSVNTIVVTQVIELASDVAIDGDNKTIQVEVPYTDETGAVRDSGFSEHGVFAINNNANVTLKNMTIFGGKITSAASGAGGIAVENGVLNAENVTVARSCRGLYIASGAKASLTGCNIVRNVCDFGGGVLCASGTLVMDACSLSENRTTQGNGGGGAIEVNGGGKFCANNTVIANNCSTEIGGAVNVYHSSAHLMNCTVAGNVTANSSNAKDGGGVGVNSGSLHAVNSIFLDNKHIPGGNGTVEPSDIGLYNADADKVKLHSCLYGTIAGGSSPSSGVADSTCKQPASGESDSVFASYRNDGILFGDSGSTTGFSHPQLVSKASGGMYSLYAPLAATNSPAASGGIETYFDKSDLDSVKMSYGSLNTSLDGLAAADSTAGKVALYYEGDNRVSSVIGASGTSSTAETYYTVKLAGQPTNGSVSGLTLNGDSKAQNDTVSFSVIPNSGYAISSISVKEDGGSGADVAYTASGNIYSFTMPAHNVVVSVTFANVTHNVKLGAALVNGAVTGIAVAGVSHGVGSAVSFTVTPSNGYEIDKIFACKTGDPSTAVTVTKGSGNGSYSFIMPDYDVDVTVAFKASAPPTPSTPSTPSYAPDPVPSVTVASPTGYGETGTISGVTSGMQYKLEGTGAWTDVPAGTTQLTGLPAGTYLVRYKGASAVTKVVIAPAPTYAVEVKAADGGTAAADKVQAMRGETVTLSAKAAKGYNLCGWLVAGELVKAGSFTMPASSVVVEPMFTPVNELFIAKAKASKRVVTLTWNPVEGAASYRVFLAKTGKKFKLAATVEAPGAGVSSADAKAACSYSAEELKADTVYKLRVHAIDEDGSKIARSTIAYVATKSSSKFANATKVSVSKKSLSLVASKKAKLSAKASRLDGKGKKGVEVIGIDNIRFKSSEPSIAKVSKNGTVTALTSGTAYIYAIVPSGVCKRITVKVRAA